MFCRYCGVELQDGSIFCHKCGKDATGQLKKREAEAIEKAHHEVKKLEFLDTKEVAKLLHCSMPTAREVMHSKGFPLVKVGRCLKVEKSAFEKWASKKT